MPLQTPRVNCSRGVPRTWEARVDARTTAAKSYALMRTPGCSDPQESGSYSNRNTVPGCVRPVRPARCAASASPNSIVTYFSMPNTDRGRFPKRGSITMDVASRVTPRANASVPITMRAESHATGARSCSFTEVGAAPQYLTHLMLQKRSRRCGVAESCVGRAACMIAP